ncbi:histidine kinase [Actinoplanes sp. NPDC051859]|uniref:sensor histidine kinase n=1 Tax=Actinoplanes sp. NPDC051859 TaxID=3363909 RepID=UPI003790B754
MERIPVWLVPAALALLQLMGWFGRPLQGYEPGSAAETATVLAVTAVTTVALVWRRTAPLAATAVVVAALTLGNWTLPPDSLAGNMEVVALYNVALRRTQHTALLTGLGIISWASVTLKFRGDLGADFPLTCSVVTVFYVTVIALGRARHRRRADQDRAAAELADAEDRRLRAADTERHRLARELHDVTAHHLTSIVVIASAAQRIGATRPELVAEARDFAARTGRDTLAALQRLVALLQRPDERPIATPRLEELAEGFRRLGQRVTVTSAATPAPAAAEAAYGIAREALTNTLRYAPGSTVAVALDEAPDGVQLTVTDDGPAASDKKSAASRLGSGRGMTGMRERAEALGGTFEAGPRDDRGWRVRAILPQLPGPHAGSRRPDAERIMDATVLLLALIVPTLTLLLVLSEPGHGMGWLAPSALTLVAHAVPLVWRRDRPWIVLAVVCVTTWAWPALVGFGVVPLEFGAIGLTGLGVEILAVHAVARYGRDSVLTWLSMVAVVFNSCPAFAVLILVDPPQDMAEDSAGSLLILTSATCAVTLCPLLLASWLSGFVLRRRRDRERARQHHAVAVATAWAHAEAHAERARVAAGLRAAVLRDTERVADAADRGDLDEVLNSARAALDGMRGLLNDLREVPAGESAAGARAPQPTIASVPALVERWRANGREVAVEITGADRTLSPDVDLSAYRVIELLLAGDTGPVSVSVDLSGDGVRIAVTPMPADPGGEVAAGLQARLTAVGGSLGTTSAGDPEIRLPAGPPVVGAAPDEEEVASSQRA